MNLTRLISEIESLEQQCETLTSRVARLKAIRTKSDSLTKYKALKAISKLTGLKQSEIINQ